MTIDDFEWVEEGFDIHLLVHKTHDLTIAVIKNFNGWYVHVRKSTSGVDEIGDGIASLEAAKVVAMIHVNQNMKGYSNVNTYRKRALSAGPQKIPKGVFKVD
jgi:hypothetical protein